MTPREPDRFDAQARELLDAIKYNFIVLEDVARVAAALRAEHASALERAAQGFDELASMSVDLDSDAAARQIRALIPPAAAPAAEPTRNDPCQRCGKLGGHPVDFSFDGISMSSWICPHCLAAQEKRLAALERDYRAYAEWATSEFGWRAWQPNETYTDWRARLAARVAPSEREGT